MGSRLVLFDIDGTLLNARGAPRTAMIKVMLRRKPDFSYNSNYSFAGRTDWEIIEELLLHDDPGFKITEAVLRQIMREFAIELEKEMKKIAPPLVFAGVAKLLQALSVNENCRLGLLTGNIKDGAKLKLRAGGLEKFFSFGAYGSDARNRSDLPVIAMNRAEKLFGIRFSVRDTWIVGDSINDISCAHDNDIRCLAVATGWTSRSELKRHNPEFLVDDLALTEEILSILLKN